MGAIIVHYSVPMEFLEILEEFKKIAKREGKTVSELFRDAVIEYTKRHGSGNPISALDKWAEQPSFKAYPAVDSDWEVAKWAEYSDRDVVHLAQKGREITYFAEREAKKRGLMV